MPNRWRLIAALTTALVTAAPVAAADRIQVVASFSILGDLVASVGGDQIELTVLVGVAGDPHLYEPTPTDVKALARADLVVVNGLEFEGWITRLVQAAAYDGPLVTATAGVPPIKDPHAEGSDHHAVDPHAWHDLGRAAIYVDNIAKGLAAVDPDHAADYAERAASYQATLAALDREIRDGLATVPAERRRVLTAHGAFRYFGAAYGLEIVAPVGVITHAEPSAAEVARLIRLIRAGGIAAVFVENLANRGLIEQITRETDASIGGILFADALTGPDGPAPTYLNLMRHNATTILTALTAD